MAKKKNQKSNPTTAPSEKPATLQDLLGADTIAKLKAQATELKQEEQQRLETERLKKEEARKAEQKKLDNNFEHLLNTSHMDWHKFK